MSYHSLKGWGGSRHEVISYSFEAQDQSRTCRSKYETENRGGKGRGVKRTESVRILAAEVMTDRTFGRSQV